MLSEFLTLMMLTSAVWSLPSDPCTDYEVMPDIGKRHVSNDVNEELCDEQHDEAKWYTLTADVSYRMPETCVPEYRCGTDAPMWLNGVHPTASNPGPVTVEVCAAFYGDCCVFSVDVEVKYCPAISSETCDFYVYKFPHAPTCSLVYCAINRDEVVVTSSSPPADACNNRGSAICDGINWRECDCTTPRYAGDRCETDLCENRCKNGGTCFVADDSLKCRCRHGFGGDRCQLKCHPKCHSASGCSKLGKGKCDRRCVPGYYLTKKTKLCKDKRCLYNLLFRRRRRAYCGWLRTKANIRRRG